MRDLATAYGHQAADPTVGEHWSGPPVLVDRLASLLGTAARHVVLDVGCGIGGPARRLAELTGCRVIGIDVVLPVLGEARRRSGPGLAFVGGEAKSLPFRDSFTDQVWALGTLSHLLDLPAFAGEALRVLRPDGVLAVTEAFGDGRRRPRFERSSPRPWRPLTVEGTVEELTSAGLQVRVVPWPARDAPGALDATDANLRKDLADDRLSPWLLVCRAAR